MYFADRAILAMVIDVYNNYNMQVQIDSSAGSVINYCRCTVHVKLFVKYNYATMYSIEYMCSL